MKSRLLLAASVACALFAVPAVAQDLRWDPSRLPAPLTGYDTDEAAKGLSHGDTPFDAILGQALKANPALASYLRHGIAKGIFVAAPVPQVGTSSRSIGDR